jgi:A118 family predicted phage portal protein
MMDISTLIKKMGFDPMDTKGGRGDIETWCAWYKGFVPEAHNYKVYNGIRHVTKKRATLGMAKRICEDWANLILNEKVSISAENESDSALIREILQENNFFVRANRLIELTFALGTGAFVENVRGGKVVIDTVRAEYIYPLAYESDRITQCAFGQKMKRGTDEFYYIQAHVKENGKNVVLNALFDANGEKIPLPDDIEERYFVPGNRTLFQIITPNCVNARRTDSPFGASVFANAIDELKGCDLIFDSLLNEFTLGKKRIFIPVSMAQMQDDGSGGLKPVFDPNDAVFHATKAMDDETKPYEINMDLRVEEHISGLESCLGVLSDKCGLGNDRYRYDNRGNAIKTATEVISDKSELFQNLKKHELIIEDALRQMAQCCLLLSAKKEAKEITISFDDSIIEDKVSEFGEMTQLVSLNVIAPWEMRAWYTGESEEEAKRKCEMISESEINLEGDE